jgi:hypothetical protein
MIRIATPVGSRHAKLKFPISIKRRNFAVDLLQEQQQANTHAS